MTKLEAQNIVKYFIHDSHKLKALGGVNLKVEAGDFCVLSGSLWMWKIYLFAHSCRLGKAR
ncbi:hypothetical protein BD31_I2185 [Candidatus Nitrosopumilus salaria BD31]|uniref:Uncharacterized protein n=1 Tax=Candidatus Nitrosopumilus salarius BD31 TaxID=859350 RepID=I3D4I8_9ARCH|nr:hypothetical protein [Candidatus Nitrosopumilus salaria]EIJ66631.1 hypothetical protein BD31_I2185 [Candidatus Nitrosopumilus salaria BD31]